MTNLTQLHQALNQFKASSNASTLTLSQTVAMLEELNMTPEQIVPVALLVQKAQGQQCAIDLLKKDNKSSIETLAERKIKTLIHNSRDSFKSLLQALTRGYFNNTNSSQTNTNSPFQQVLFLMQQLESTQALVELMWEMLPEEAQAQLQTLLD